MVAETSEIHTNTNERGYKKWTNCLLGAVFQGSSAFGLSASTGIGGRVGSKKGLLAQASPTCHGDGAVAISKSCLSREHPRIMIQKRLSCYTKTEHEPVAGGKAYEDQRASPASTST